MGARPPVSHRRGATWRTPGSSPLMICGSSEVTVELHQFVSAGQRLFEADSLSAAEVEARIPISAMRRLVGAVAPARIPEGALDIDERIDLGD
jgi:hypothetical protein